MSEITTVCGAFVWRAVAVRALGLAVWLMILKAAAYISANQCSSHQRDSRVAEI